jgi:hypothetical protein
LLVDLSKLDHNAVAGQIDSEFAQRIPLVSISDDDVEVVRADGASAEEFQRRQR